MNKILTLFKRNRNIILLCLAATFGWGLIAHSYIFLHSSFSHDSLNEFNAAVFGNNLRLQYGRVFVPLYRLIIREPVVLPWLIGMLALLYISVAVLLTVKLFNIRSRAYIILISGVYTINIPVIATAATYIHDLDCNMLALTLAVFSVYLWQRSNRGFLYGMIPLCVSIGIYQSYISVTITLIIIYLVMKLLEGENAQTAVKKGAEGVVMILGGGALYFIAINMGVWITGVSLKSGNYNSIDIIFSMSPLEVFLKVIEGYSYTCYKFFNPTSVYSKPFVFIIHIIMASVTGMVVLLRVFQKEFGIKERLLTLLLIALLPLSSNIVYGLTGGMSHSLMEFALCLGYLLILLIARWAAKEYDTLQKEMRLFPKLASVCLVLIVLWGNVQTANGAYLKKDLEQQANLSLFTRIVYEMESCEWYKPAITPVVFVGTPKLLLQNAPGFENIYDITGSWSPFVLNLNERERYRAYFDYVLLNPAVMADNDVWIRMAKDYRVENMSCYPEDGSIAIIDDVMVVKLSD